MAKITTNTPNGNITITPNGTGEVDISKVDIDSGTIDGVTIGGSSAGAGTFTTVNATTVDSTNFEVTNIKAKDGTSAGSIANSTGVVTLASSVLTTADINGGTIDGTDITIGAGKTLNVSAGTLNVSAGTLTLANNQISGNSIDGGTISNFASTGITDGASSTALTIDASGAVVISKFVLNASSTAGTGFFGSTSNNGSILPADGSGAAIDNVKNLGRSDIRFTDAYITNDVTSGSDGRQKQDIEELSEAEQRVALACKGLLRKFRWKDMVAEKGDNARIHFGIIAQDLKAAFEAEGLDAGRYGMFIHSTWWEAYTEVPAVEAQDAVYETQIDENGNEVQVLVSEAVEAQEAYIRTDTYDTEEEAPEGAVKKDRMGIRYSELLAFIIAAI